jgi:hypothetical protein
VIDAVLKAPSVGNPIVGHEADQEKPWRKRSGEIVTTVISRNSDLPGFVTFSCWSEARR